MRTSIAVMVSIAILVAAAAAVGDGVAKSPAEATISDMAWLAGYWRSERAGSVFEECWLAPAGPVMVGLRRDILEDGNVMFEYLRIMETANGLVYYRTPRGYDTAKFTLTSLNSDGDSAQAVFENPEEIFPRLIRYSLRGQELMAEAEGTSDDQKVISVWTWKRAPFPQDPAR
jgi:hypothetical protein